MIKIINLFSQIQEIHSLPEGPSQLLMVLMGKYCDTDFYAQISCVSYVKKEESEILNGSYRKNYYPYTLTGKINNEMNQI